MLYAKIVVGLPVDGPFDYLVPDSLVKEAACGKRAWVNFGFKRTVGYIVGLSAKTQIKNTKPLLDIIDGQPVLSAELLKLSEELSAYFCCSWGEAIEATLPQVLRKGRKLVDLTCLSKAAEGNGFNASLIFCPDNRLRFEHYLQEIKQTVNDKQAVIVILADKRAGIDLKKEIEGKLGYSSAVLCRNEPGELEEWIRSRCGKTQIIIGTRSAVFAPFENPGLIILDEEENSVYKQEQVPHYHTREVALMRAKISGCRLILGSSSPSLESFYLAKNKKIGYAYTIKKQNLPEIKIIDLNREYYRAKSERPVLSRYLSDCIAASLSVKDKVLLFLNRRGFATSAACHNCKKPLVCPRCNTSLIYFYEGDILACSHCNFKLIPPKICPQCNSGYIKFKGAGTEKIESEISRIFPQARIKNISTLEKIDLASADIFVATRAIFKQKGAKFHLVGVLGIDNALNRLDFRSAEKTFAVLQELVTIAEKRIVIQTSSGRHHLFEAIAKNDPEIFYNKELQERKQLGYPPYKHIILIKLRSKYPEKAQKSAEALFEKLSQAKIAGIELASINPSNPPKLRGNYCWQIMFKAAGPGKAVKFIKLNLKDFRHSGIIVTVDVDPV